MTTPIDEAQLRRDATPATNLVDESPTTRSRLPHLLADYKSHGDQKHLRALLSALVTSIAELDAALTEQHEQADRRVATLQSAIDNDRQLLTSIGTALGDLHVRVRGLEQKVSK